MKKIITRLFFWVFMFGVFTLIIGFSMLWGQSIYKLYLEGSYISAVFVLAFAAATIGAFGILMVEVYL